MSVYFIHEEGDLTIFKIGKSMNVSERLPQLQTGNHRKLCVYRTIETPEYDTLEKILHHTFTEKCIAGEWYKISHSVISFICRMVHICNENKIHINSIADVLRESKGSMEGGFDPTKVYEEITKKMLRNEQKEAEAKASIEKAINVFNNLINEYNEKCKEKVQKLKLELEKADNKHKVRDIGIQIDRTYLDLDIQTSATNRGFLSYLKKYRLWNYYVKFYQNMPANKVDDNTHIDHENTAKI